MDMILAVVTLLSLTLAAVMNLVAWRLTRGERRRSAARVEALAAAIHGTWSVTRPEPSASRLLIPVVAERAEPARRQPLGLPPDDLDWRPALAIATTIDPGADTCVSTGPASRLAAIIAVGVFVVGSAATPAVVFVAAATLAVLVASMHGQQTAQQGPPNPDESFRFRGGVEMINVTATVSDASGRFVSGLRKEDFVVYEDDRPQTVTHFSSDRVPVSLGIALDTSGSMVGDKIANAQSALNRFLYDLLGPQDEVFLYRFSSNPIRLQGWTTDRDVLSRALGRIAPNGVTAMYDTVAEAIPLAQEGRHRKKALLIISDGNDTTSRIGVREVKSLIRESEVMVYAIGIDGESDPTFGRTPPPRAPIQIPFPFPPRGRGRSGWPIPPPRGGGSGTGGGWAPAVDDDRVNAMALREMTDDSGGRTVIVRYARDLNPATANVADELSKQYCLGYPASGKRDGRWHTIRVEVRNQPYRVRARRGYVAS
jgi:Ca-activated chloride channel family protein